ncbi:MAG: hypothetical protein ACTHML_08710 [Ginsengibacter sp.]
MNIPLTYCPRITNTQDFFKAEMVVYINLYKAPEEVSPTGLKLIKIYGTPGEMYHHFTKGYMTPVFEETEYQLLILWNQPLQEILNSDRVFDFSAWDRQKDKIILTRHEFLSLLPASLGETKRPPSCKN